jgi:hypothetical protein
VAHVGVAVKGSCVWFMALLGIETALIVIRCTLL